ncbi:MAG: GatB/YqeY domain-containing protein [Nannocystaceae bacterium]
MSAIRQQIDARLRQARIDRDGPTRDVIGMVKAKALMALKSGSKGREEDDPLWREVLAAYAKELKKAMASYAGLGERGQQGLNDARFELDFCEQFLPKKLDKAATEALVRRIATENGLTEAKQTGRLMGLVMKSHRHEIDGDLARGFAQEILRA